MKIHLKPLLVSLLISLGVGGLASFVTSGSYSIYKKKKKPALYPPGWLFPIVWGILYFLMGISSYIIFTSNSDSKNNALKFYALQLIVNFFWPILFFNLELFWVAFFWLILLVILVIITIVLFKKIDSIAAWLLIPYLIWILFASYLNLSIAILN